MEPTAFVCFARGLGCNQTKPVLLLNCISLFLAPTNIYQIWIVASLEPHSRNYYDFAIAVLWKLDAVQTRKAAESMVFAGRRAIDASREHAWQLFFG
jgi:hypothetical protein